MKEHDIRPAEIFARYLELSRADAVERFGAGTVRAAVPCPGCGAWDEREAFVKDGFRYCECHGCETLYASPRPGPEALADFYADSPSATYWAEVFFPASMAARREQLFVPRVERVVQLMDERAFAPGTIIDVGAGYGVFLEEYRRRRPHSVVLAVEPGQKLASICRSRGLETLEQPAEGAQAWAERGDLAVCFEVIEHVHNTLEFSQALAALIRPGGYLVLTTLGVEGFDIQVLWEKSKSISPPHHLNFLSLQGFTRLLRRAGFEAIDVLTPGRLDVDIVLNTLGAASEVEDRFLRRLLARDDATRAAFQAFLAAHRLSSHTWVVARRGRQPSTRSDA